MRPCREERPPEDERRRRVRELRARPNEMFSMTAAVHVAAEVVTTKSSSTGRDEFVEGFAGQKVATVENAP